MIPCLGCRRHVRADAKSCPFCRTALHDAPAPQSRWAIALLGIALAGCGTRADDGTSSDSIADGSSSQGSNSDNASSWSTGDDSVTTVNSAGCMTYAGPSCGGDWSTSEDGQGTAESSSEGGTTDGESSTGDDSSSSSDSTSGGSDSDSSSSSGDSSSGAPQ